MFLVLDCCHTAGAVTKGVGGTVEILAGCSREGEAGGPGSSRALGSPFTHVLTKHLSESVPPCGLHISELFTIMSLDKILEILSPIHVFLTGHRNPIKLGPLEASLSRGVGGSQALYLKRGAGQSYNCFHRLSIQ
jgi:hypothetical protein